MYLVYQPEGDEQPQRWKYNPRKLMSAERELLERKTGKNFTEFTKDVVAGSSVCRRALLYVFLKRAHAKLRYEDVDFAWDELRLEYSKGELQQIRDEVADALSGDQAAAALAKLDEQIADAFDDTENEGKASLPIAD